LKKEKRVSNKDHLIAAKEKTTQNMRRELSDERGGEEDNGANPEHIPAKTNSDKENLKK
jgi:hypothetical protein